MNKGILEVTERIIERSRKTREIYLERIAEAEKKKVHRAALGCSNLAHVMAAESAEDKAIMSGMKAPNIGIITAYNDMLSAHQPFADFPLKIKAALREVGATCQVASGVPAMCDGVTQSQPGMELSLFSRDTIAMSTAVGLSHNVYEGAIYLGVCDKIVPGLVIGALTFGHLPAVFIPAGPMRSGISNAQKGKVRQEFALGNVGVDVLLQSESACYHSSGTCTFYGTANSNQMMMDVMGLHLPGGTFVNPDTPLREAITVSSAQQIVKLTQLGENFMPVGRMIDEKSIVNALVGLMATGGSTNHTMHLIAMAKAAGIHINWEDFDDISSIVPLITRLYPNGSADVNQFHDAGGMGYVISQLLDAGILHEDVNTIVGKGLAPYATEASLVDDRLTWTPAPDKPRDPEIVSTVDEPFDHHGGLTMLGGNLGRSVIKTSALKPTQLCIEAPAVVFESQEELQAAFKAHELDKDFIAIVRYQGPKANGMPELHGLMAPLGALQDKGFKVAVVTDGRMSGASGKVPSAIHVTPEALDGGMLSKVQNGDIVVLDVEAKTLELKVSAEELAAREEAHPDLSHDRWGTGRELFAMMRHFVGSAEMGASIFDSIGEEQA
ncbi:phosphogluconate dehydratase [Thiomicrorhabdus heinhorstiae]|uniref:Phosphogluconate dehydratase n=1 Tax=Thiomicrorhabdus heinhorstiae TaxID=2748010 RepID=A0ABS0BT35_9GAMM|nr:phosphogluconate dehydratase [Thiomicrorhabdus heinhorstiae]MBF6057012.1 phosphogluconate dehydratase [Thiomicrorhabdus heinhorstiae]